LKPVISPNAPKPFGPYSQAIIANGMVYTAGQVGVDPKTGKLEGGIKPQTIRVLENLKAVLEAAGSSIDRVVKVTVYLKNRNDFAEMNKVFATYFENSKPARATVQAELLESEMLVEMDAVAVLS